MLTLVTGPCPLLNIFSIHPPCVFLSLDELNGYLVEDKGGPVESFNAFSPPQSLVKLQATTNKREIVEVGKDLTGPWR